jgi:hypothetical protein
LKVSDIRKLKKGEKIKVIFFDRNVGDYLHGTKKGEKILTRDYLKEFHLYKYVQSEEGGLHGKLHQ